MRNKVSHKFKPDWNLTLDDLVRMRAACDDFGSDTAILPEKGFTKSFHYL